MTDDPHPVVEAPVTVVVPPPAAPVAARATVAPDTVVASPLTTQEQDRVTQGQRDTSMMWETTQRQLALGFLFPVVLLSFVVVVAYLFLDGQKERLQPLALVAMTFLMSTSSLILGTYFQRTNHTKIGGVVGGPGER